jgi:pyruvate,orthophosphate dikinase
MNRPAITYQWPHDITESWRTTVNVEGMVFSNTGETSATGAFTRKPSTGERYAHSHE